MTSTPSAFLPFHPLRTFAAATLILLFCFSLYSLPAVAAEQRLWSLVSYSDFQSQLDAIDLPGQAERHAPVTIPGGVLAELQAGDELLLALAYGMELDYGVTTVRAFRNGDSALRALLTEPGRPYMLTLTSSGTTLVATVFSPAGKFYLSAAYVAADAQYVGWLYRYPSHLTILPADEGGYTGARYDFVDQAALGSGDVTIEQALSGENATIGDQLDVTVTVTNNLGTTLSNEAVNILFVADDAEYLGSSGGCSLGTTGSQPAIRCNIASLAPGASTSFDYSVRITDDSYPQLASSVFVGDLFGENVRHDAFVFVNRDTLLDSDGDGFSDFNETLLGSNQADADSNPGADFVARVDLLFLYTERFASDAGSVSSETRINQMVEITNGYYANSGVGIEFRPVYYGEVDYAVSNLNDAIDAMGDGSGIFADVVELRNAVGADIVVLVDGIIGDDNSCGLARTPGGGYNGELFHPRVSNPDLFTVLYMDGFPVGADSGCEDDTLAHELGHNFGLVHSRRENGSEGTLPWSHGYGVDGSFVTLMAYVSRFPGAEPIPLFSNPDSSECKGMPCGITRADLEQGADAVHSLNHTRFQVAARHASRLLDAAALSGSSDLIMYGGARRSGESQDVSVFSSQDSIDVRATLRIPTLHRGKAGRTHIVVAVDGAGLFYRDVAGGYVEWDGALDTLGSSIEPRSLRPSEELVAFSDFVPAAYAVSSASVTVYFAYSLTEDDTFVYSSNGIPFSIQ